MKSIREAGTEKQIEKAADALYPDYSSDKELTALAN
ncbi:hypothetical protein FHS90_000096 [Rufibacter quisquiliarum]|uniref:Uncharacterized protein n=1 Tax=Rufibacter quisquiliarum TaxID=1549639 RepID=A0A839GFF0_9BACT|nr:hypothetical protein [Rufibacter quisquiliarum]